MHCINFDTTFSLQAVLEALAASASVQQEPATFFGPEEIVAKQPPFNQPTLDASVTVETESVGVQVSRRNADTNQAKNEIKE